MNGSELEKLKLVTRRKFFQQCGTGMGALALASLLNENLFAAEKPGLASAPLGPHFKPKAKNIIYLFQSGGPSHLDLFDYKPELIKRHDTPMPGSDKLITFQGENGNLIKPLWPFRPRGQSGKMVSDLLPNLAELADEMCFIHSMTAKSNTHGPAEKDRKSVV